MRRRKWTLPKAVRVNRGLRSFGAFAFHTVNGYRKKGIAARPIGRSVFPNGSPNEGLPRFWSDCGLPFEQTDDWIFRRVLTAADASRIDARKVQKRYEDLATSWRWQPGSPVRILDKCPNYIFMVAAIDRVFPDSLHIFCVRDTRDTVASIARRFHSPPPKANMRGYSSGWYSNIVLPGHERYEDASVEARHAWQVEQILAIGFAEAKRLGARCLTSHHEDLLRDPVAELKKIARFVDADVPDNPQAILDAGLIRM